MIGASIAAGRGVLASCTTSAGRVVCTSAAGAGIAVGVLVLIYVAVLVVVILAYVRIVTKAGYSGWWVLIALVPIANVVMFLIFAFSEWPIQRELASLRSRRGYLGGGGYEPPIGSWGGAGPSGGDPGTMFRPPNTPPAAGPIGTYGFQPEPPGSSGPLPSEAALPSFLQGPSAPAGGDSTPSGLADMPSSPDASGGQVPPSTTQPLPSAQPGAAPAGWYPTPDGRRRYWDGAAWTDHFA